VCCCAYVGDEAEAFGELAELGVFVEFEGGCVGEVDSAGESACAEGLEGAQGVLEECRGDALAAEEGAEADVDEFDGLLLGKGVQEQAPFGVLVVHDDRPEGGVKEADGFVAGQDVFRFADGAEGGAVVRVDVGALHRGEQWCLCGLPAEVGDADERYALGELGGVHAPEAGDIPAEVGQLGEPAETRGDERGGEVFLAWLDEGLGQVDVDAVLLGWGAHPAEGFAQEGDALVEAFGGLGVGEWVAEDVGGGGGVWVLEGAIDPGGATAGGDDHAGLAKEGGAVGCWLEGCPEA